MENAANKRKVMIVDDSPTIKYEARTLLQSIGVQVIEAGGRLGMYNQIEEYGKMVDLIIMDLTLKEENGLDLIKELKAENRYKDIGILIMSAHADKDTVLAAKSLGVDGYIVKPIKQDDFINKVTLALADSIARRAKNK